MVCEGREFERRYTPIPHYVIRLYINCAFNKRDRQVLLRYLNPVFPIPGGAEISLQESTAKHNYS